MGEAADSRQSLDLVGRLLSALRDSTSPDNFCQRLALNVLRDYQVEATYVARLDSDGCVTMVGSWGYPPERRRSDDRPSIRTPMAITDTIRSGKTLVFETWDAYIAQYPHLAHRAGPGKAFVCVPFSVDGTRPGGFGITFAASLEQLPISERVLDLMAMACDVMISGSWAQAAFTGNELAADPRGFADLSSRQKNILQLVSEGYTNPEIALKLRFSSSLIKKELQGLYRIFGVQDRKALGSLASATLDDEK